MLRRLRLAEVTSEFQQMLRRLRNQPVYVCPKAKKNLPAITVHRQFDPTDDDGLDGYYFAERAGRDSVAFLLVDRSGPQPLYGVLTQWHGPLRRFVVGAFTGSLDKEDLSIEQIVQEELVEEAGYMVEPCRLIYVSAEPVSGQTNEQVHLFLVDTTGLQQTDIAPENIFEANMQVNWMPHSQAMANSEWKGRLILLSEMAPVT